MPSNINSPVSSLADWSAKRSGATITVKGTDTSGNEVTLTGVTEIKTQDGALIACYPNRPVRLV